MYNMSSRPSPSSHPASPTIGLFFRETKDSKFLDWIRSWDGNLETLLKKIKKTTWLSPRQRASPKVMGALIERNGRLLDFVDWNRCLVVDGEEAVSNDAFKLCKIAVLQNRYMLDTAEKILAWVVIQYVNVLPKKYESKLDEVEKTYKKNRRALRLLAQVDGATPNVDWNDYETSLQLLTELWSLCVSREESMNLPENWRRGRRMGWTR